jgi:broad specificity phosphatase PhoE
VLVLVRHGRTTINAEGRLLGRLDPPLDAVGRMQADAVAADLAGGRARVARVVSSSLARARETAEVIAAGIASEVEVDDRWIELDYGELDGTAVADVPADVWAAWRADPGYLPPGGESLLALGRRVGEACAELAEEAAVADVVVVTHVSPVKAAVVWALGVGDEISWRTHVAPASITRLGFGRWGPVLRSFNETGHLAGVISPS